MSVNVWLAFGGVFLLGLIGFLVAWFSTNVESPVRSTAREVRASPREQYIYRLLVSFRDFDEAASRLAMTQEQVQRLVSDLRESLASESVAESSKKVRT